MTPGERNRTVLSARVSPEYFDTVGLRILEGRPLQAADTLLAGDAPVVVSRRFGARLFPGRSPLGQVLTVAGQGQSRPRLVVVGVAADRATGFGPMRAPNDGSFMYRLKEPSLTGFLLVRFDGDAARFTTALRNRMRDATGWIVQVSTIESSLERRSLFRIRELERWMTAIGTTGLALALIGVFGLLLFTSALRRKEMAIRTALGASRADVFRAMVLPILRPIGFGIVAGAFLSFAALRMAESQRDVPLAAPSIEPVVYLAGGVLLLLSALVAMTPPAYRAAVSDPARALRED
jgi:hypothetical protein